MHRSAVRRLLETLAKRHREGVAALAPDALRSWQRLMIAGITGMIALMYILVQFAKRLDTTGHLAWETDFLRALQAGGPFTFSTAVFFQTFGTDITLAILIILTAGIAVWCRRPITAWSILLAYAVTDPVVRLGWRMWDRTRPSVLYDGVAAPAFHSFPSGHTGKTLAVYGILVFIWARTSRSPLERIIALLMLAAIAVVVPVGRMSMGVHWPSDILAGWILGLFWLCVLASGLRFETLQRSR
jgi:undecaprenyl-diphosphatase